MSATPHESRATERWPAWASSLAVAGLVALLALVPEPLIPLARAYRAL